MSISSVNRKIIEFHDDATALEMSRPPILSWITFILLSILLLGFIIWSIVFKVDRVVTADGKLVTVRQNIVMKPMERVVIKRVHVKVGEIVRGNQLLFTFDPTFSQADVDRLQIQYDSYKMHIDRLQAELAKINFENAALSANRNYQRQISIYLERERFLKEKLIYFDENLKRLSAILRTRKRNLEKQQERLEALQKLESMFQSLHGKGAASLKDLIEMQISRMQMEGECDQLEGRITEGEHDLLSAQAEKNSFLNEWYEGIAQELLQVEREMDAVIKQLDKAKRSNVLTELRAPCDAIVHEISASQEGSAVREAEPLITLVPIGVEIEAQASVNPRDIGKIKAGDNARIKLDAFPFQRHGTLDGTVRAISEDTMQEQGNALEGEKSFYHVLLSISGHLNSNTKDYRLIPGMKTTVEIKVGQKRIIEYLIDPLIKTLDESLNEP